MEGVGVGEGKVGEPGERGRPARYPRNQQQTNSLGENEREPLAVWFGLGGATVGPITDFFLSDHSLPLQHCKV